MRLVGWNNIPRGDGAAFDLSGAPLWLRVWFRTPILDRFVYPVAVRRGYGWLTLQPGFEAGVVSDGWRLRPDGYAAPGSVAPLRQMD